MFTTGLEWFKSID